VGLVVECGICGRSIRKVKRRKGRRLYCNNGRCVKERKRVAMKLYRMTEKGRLAMAKQNVRYKKADMEYVCVVCGGKFMSARKKREACDKKECQRRMRSISVSRCMDRKKAGNVISKHAGEVFNERILTELLDKMEGGHPSKKGVNVLLFEQEEKNEKD
jgi:hypothetical protein